MWYEPIFDEGQPDDLTKQDITPEIGLYCKSHGGPEGAPMLGEVSWECLFDEKLFESNNRKERVEMQRKTLYDAWRYLKATEPRDIMLIELQLRSGDPRQVALEKESKAARKLRSRSAKHRRQIRVARGLPAKSIENDSDSDSGFGSDSDEMPPPPRPSVQPRSTPDEFSMSGGRGNSINAERYSRGSERLNSMRPFTAGKRPSFLGSNGINKRKQASEQRSQRRSRQRTEGSEGGLFLSQQNSQGGSRLSRGDDEDEDEDDDLMQGGSDDQNANGGLDETSAIKEAMRLSLVPEDRSVRDQNGGLHPDVAFDVTMRKSTAPEAEIEE